MPRPCTDCPHLEHQPYECTGTVVRRWEEGAEEDVKCECDVSPLCESDHDFEMFGDVRSCRVCGALEEANVA